MADTISVSIISGVVGALVGAYGTIYSGNRQITATTISANRQSWINALRDEIAAFITSLQVMCYAKHASFVFKPAEAQDAARGVLLSEAKIRLMVNPNESAHIRLLELLDESLHVSASERENDETAEDAAMRLRNAISLIVGQSQLILKSEWVRVKEGL